MSLNSKMNRAGEIADPCGVSLFLIISIKENVAYFHFYCSELEIVPHPSVHISISFQFFKLLVKSIVVIIVVRRCYLTIDVRFLLIVFAVSLHGHFVFSEMHQPPVICVMLRVRIISSKYTRQNGAC